MPGMTAQTMLQARRIHRANACAARELVETYAAKGPDQARTLYQRATAEGGAENLLMMLWGTAITVQRQVTEANADGGRGRN
jgi:hypothetical protein